MDLPFGKGMHFLPDVTGVAGKLISGSSVNGITTFQSGFPLAMDECEREFTLGEQLGYRQRRSG